MKFIPRVSLRISERFPTHQRDIYELNNSGGLKPDGDVTTRRPTSIHQCVDKLLEKCVYRRWRLVVSKDEPCTACYAINARILHNHHPLLEKSSFSPLVVDAVDLVGEI